MKKILSTCLPAPGSAHPGQLRQHVYLTTTEDDGVYYSSKDRTTQNATASTAPYGQSGTTAPADQPADEATNPEYRSGSSGSSGSGRSSDYYDEDYGYAARIRRFHQPMYRGFSYGYYDVVYADPFYYGGGGYSPFGWGSGYGSYYDPFYSPYGYGGSLITINIGFGRPYYNPGATAAMGMAATVVTDMGATVGMADMAMVASADMEDMATGATGPTMAMATIMATATATAAAKAKAVPPPTTAPRRDGAHEANNAAVDPTMNGGGRGRGRIDGGVPTLPAVLPMAGCRMAAVVMLPWYPAGAGGVSWKAPPVRGALLLTCRSASLRTCASIRVGN